MPDGNEIFKFLKENGLTQKDEATFTSEYSDPKKAAELHKFFVDNQLTTKDSAAFYDTYFNPQKKKGLVAPTVGKQDGSTSNLGGVQEPIKPTKVSFDPNKIRGYEAALEERSKLETKNREDIIQQDVEKIPQILRNVLPIEGIAEISKLKQKAGFEATKKPLTPQNAQRKRELDGQISIFEKELTPLIEKSVEANKGRFSKDGKIDYKSIYSAAEGMSKNVGGGKMLKEVFAQKMIEGERVSLMKPKVEKFANEIYKNKTGKTIDEEFSAIKSKAEAEQLAEAAKQKAYVKKEFATLQKEAEEKITEESKTLFNEVYAPQFDLITDQKDFDETVAKYRADLKNIVERENSRLKRIGNELNRQAEQKIEAFAIKYNLPQSKMNEIKAVYDEAYDKAIESDYEAKAAAQKETIQAVGVGGLFIKSLAEGFNIWLASSGAGIVGLGMNNGLTDWLRSRQQQVDALQTIDLPFEGLNLLRPETYATRLGKQLGMQAPAMALTFATRNPYIGGTIGMLTEQTQIAGDTYNQVLQETGDPARAAQAAQNVTAKGIGTAPLYFIEADMFLKAAKGIKQAAKSMAIQVPIENVQELTQGYGQFQETEKGKGATFKEYFDEQGLETIKETTVLTILQQGAFGGIGQAYNAIATANKNVGEQYLLDIVRKSGLAEAGAVVEQLALNGKITDEELISIKESMASVDADIQAMRSAGVEEKKIQGYIANLSAINDIKKQESELAADSPLRQTLTEKRLKLEQESRNLAIGGGTSVTVTLPNGTEVAVPKSNINQTIEKLAPEIADDKVSITAEGESASEVTKKVDEIKKARRLSKLKSDETEEGRRTTKLEPINAPLEAETPKAVEQSLQSTPQAGVVGGDVEVKSDIEAKKADIEKRRQEELKEYSYDIVEKVEDYEFTDEDGKVIYVQVRTYKDGSRRAYQSIEKNKYGNTLDNEPFNISKDQSTEDYLKYYEDWAGTKKKTGERTAEEANLIGRKNKINAKYDAELKAVEQSLQSTPQAGVVGANPALKDVESLTSKAKELSLLNEKEQKRILDLAANEATLSKQESQELSILRRKRDKSMQNLEREFRDISERNGGETNPKSFNRQDRQQWRLLQRELQMVNEAGADVQQTEYGKIALQEWNNYISTDAGKNWLKNTNFKEKSLSGDVSRRGDETSVGEEKKSVGTGIQRENIRNKRNSKNRGDSSINPKKEIIEGDELVGSPYESIESTAKKILGETAVNKLKKQGYKIVKGKFDRDAYADFFGVGEGVQADEFEKSGLTIIKPFEKIKVFRGVGKNVEKGDNNAIQWVAEDERIAKNYSSENQIQQLEVNKPQKAFENPENDVYVTNKDVANRLRKIRDKLFRDKKIDKKQAEIATSFIDEFEQVSGNEPELYSTKTNKKESADLYAKSLISLGYDGIVQKESFDSKSPFKQTTTENSSNTYGIFNPKLVKAVEELLGKPKEAAQTAAIKPEIVTEKEVAETAKKTGITPKNLRDLYKINRELFGLDRIKSLAAAIAMDRMVGAMAKRAGITKEQMYGRLKFEKASEQDLPQGVKFQVDAWHGSPYQFDKFTTEKIGTGEGAQAFGWGLYFTDLKGIAEEYARRLANDLPTIDGKKIDDWFRDNDLKAPYSSNYWMPELLAESKSKEDALSKIDIRIKSQEGKIDGYNDILDDPDATFNERANARMALENLEKDLQVSYDLYNAVYRSKEFTPPSKNRNVYKVSLHKGKTPDQYTWLEWDKPVSKKMVANLLFKLNTEKSGLYVDFLETKEKQEKVNAEIRELEKEGNKIINENKATNEEISEYLNRIRSKKAELKYIEINQKATDLSNQLRETRLGRNFVEIAEDGLNGGVFYKFLEGISPEWKEGVSYDFNDQRGAKWASLFLLENGIDGIKYPAESISRGATSDTARGFNYVVFDENAVSIEEVIKFQKDAEKARGAMMISMDGQAVIYALTDPNVSTPLHEMAHVFEHYLTDAERAAVQLWAGTKAWTTKTSEAFARGFEKYLAEGKAPTPALQKIFEKFKQWLTDIYNGITGSEIDIELNDQMREIYAKMLGEEFVAPIKKEVTKERAATPITPQKKSLDTQKVIEAFEKISNLLDLKKNKSTAEQRDITKEIREASQTTPKAEFIFENWNNIKKQLKFEQQGACP